MSLPVSVPFQADDFRMVLVTHNDCGVTLVGVVANKGLDPRHPGTSGIDELEAG